jgi:uncharacterized membrane protein YbaN (DUF454 family)
VSVEGRPVRRWLLFLTGWLALVVGVVGTILPVLPTTPLLLLAGFCFARSSPRLHRRMLEHPRFGPALSQWREDRSVSPGAKRKASVLVVLTFGVSIALVDHLALHITLATLGAAVLVFLYLLPTRG